MYCNLVNTQFPHACTCDTAHRIHLHTHLCRIRIVAAQLIKAVDATLCSHNSSVYKANGQCTAPPVHVLYGMCWPDDDLQGPKVSPY